MPLKYKVGDVVFLKVEIMNTDPSDQRLAYETINGFWFTESDVIAFVPKSIPALPEPPKPLERAEFVRTRDGEVGQVIKIDDDDDTVWILFSDSEFHWLGNRSLTRTAKPADWPF